MAQSSEYPDLRWVAPKSWTNANRSSVQLVVIHTTEGSATSSAAEDGAAYDARRTDGTSTHYFHDADTTVQCVRTEDKAHTARTQGNARGIHHELCTRAGSATWSNAYHQAMLRQAAKQAARDCVKWGIPVRHLTVEQVADGVKGFAGHYDITRAFPQDGGTHTDPGSAFPWSQFLDMVRDELDGDDMAFTETEMQAFPWQLLARTAQGGDPNMSTLAVLNGTYTSVKAVLSAVASNASAEAQRDAQQNATLAGMLTLLNTVVASNGTMSQAQLDALTEQIAQVAADAGAQASAVVEAKLDSLRHHLGDNEL